MTVWTAVDGEALAVQSQAATGTGVVNKVSLPYDPLQRRRDHSQRQFRSYQWLYDPSTGIEAYNSVAYNIVGDPQVRLPIIVLAFLIWKSGARPRRKSDLYRIFRPEHRPVPGQG